MGHFVSTVEVKDIQLPESMQRAMAKQAEAEREKRAKVIAAEGEQLSAAKLGEAADILPLIQLLCSFGICKSCPTLRWKRTVP